MKKALIIYDSIYGNTKKVAMALSRGLEAGGIYVDSKFVSDCKPDELEDYDIIGIGGPTHFHGISKSIKLFLSKLEKIELKNKTGFAFETKAEVPLAGSAGKKIMKSLKKMDLKIIDVNISGKVLEKEGPLVESTLKAMEQLGITISEKINPELLKIFKEGCE
jgi:flavodoxin